jgi:hypothetical protein
VASRSSERDSEDLLAALYAATPNEFVAARDRVAAELKQAGRTEEAARVKALKRPTASVWAVNQLARQESDGVAELLALAERVHTHERQVLRGGDASGYLDDARLVRQRAAQLARRAEALLSASGLSTNAAVGRRIVQTLQAAALGDDEARAALAAGTLSADLTPTASFGGATPDLANSLAASLASATAARSKPGKATATDDGKSAAADRKRPAAAGHDAKSLPAERKRGAAVEAPAASTHGSGRGHAATGAARKPAPAGERVAQRKQAVAARRQATAERKHAAAAARAQAAAERKQAALDARAQRAQQRRAEAAARKRVAAATRELATAERAVATHRSAVERARAAVEAAESRLRAAKDALAAAETQAAAARRALDDASGAD